MADKRSCPHCGNSNSKFIQNNGEGPSSPDLTLLCVARVLPADWSFGVELPPLSDDYDSQGLVPCGMQWDPNQ